MLINDNDLSGIIWIVGLARFSSNFPQRSSIQTGGRWNYVLAPIDKKSLSERDICTKYITPALVTAGWDVQTQIREEVSFTDGQVIVKGKTVTRGKVKRADYILSHQPNVPLAVVEAKDNKQAIGAGMQQALDSADVRQQIEGPIRTTSGVKNINSTEISNLIVPIPPLAEQTRIVERVECLMGLCDQLESQLTQQRTDADRLTEAMVVSILNQPTANALAAT